jgi:hypothetical protein
MLLSRHEDSGQGHDIQIGNRSFENVQIFGNDSRNQNLIQEEIKRRLNSSNACYDSIQKFCYLVCCLKT